jgi:hypothetical protein
MIFDMFVLIFYLSDLNIDQFDMNFGLTFSIYYGQFASTAARASSSTSPNFSSGYSSGGILGNDAECPVCFDPYSCRIECLGFPSSSCPCGYLDGAPLSFISVVLCVMMALHLPLSLSACIPIEGGVVLYA